MHFDVFPGFRPFLNACSRKVADHSRRARSVWKFTMTHSFYPAYGINSKQSSSYTPSISNPHPLSDFFTARRHSRPSESPCPQSFPDLSPGHSTLFPLEVSPLFHCRLLPSSSPEAPSWIPAPPRPPSSRRH